MQFPLLLPIMFQPVQGLWDGPSLGGNIVAEWRRLATVFPDLPVSFSGWTGAKFSEPSGPGAIPQHQRPEPPDQSAPCHPVTADCQFWQRGQRSWALRLKSFHKSLSLSSSLYNAKVHVICAQAAALSQQCLSFPSLSSALQAVLGGYLCVVFLQALQVRRANCEHQNRDPIVWTCHRVMKWLRDIDLKVYAGCHRHVFPLLTWLISNAKCNQTH